MSLEQNLVSEDSLKVGGKVRKYRMSEHELEDLREHIDAIAFNLGKVYQHAKDRARKQTYRSELRKRQQSVQKYNKSHVRSTGD